VDVVAIAALNQPLIHSMMERHLELGPLLEMAGVAKLRLGLDEQELRFFRMVRRMARNATDVILRVNRVERVHVLGATRMACQAARIDFFGRGVFKGENLRFVAAAIHVSFPRTVASFAAMPPRAFFCV
jgi:hypothetical protein